MKIYFLYFWFFKVDEDEEGIIRIEVNGYYCFFCFFYCNNKVCFILLFYE